jgi:hypothetical protein
LYNFSFLEQSSNKPFLINNNNSQSLSNNSVIVPLQDYPEENNEIVVHVKKNKTTIKQRIFLAIFLIFIVAIGTSIFIITKRSSNQSLSGRFDIFEYICISPHPFEYYSYFGKKSFIYYR